MTPRWKITGAHIKTPRYECIAHLWAADIWKKMELDETHYRWGVVLSDERDDQYWFDDVEDFLRMVDDRWLGHFPDGFDDQLRAIVMLLD